MASVQPLERVSRIVGHVRADEGSSQHRFHWPLPVEVLPAEREAAHALAQQALNMAVAQAAAGQPYNAELRKGNQAWDAGNIAVIDNFAERVTPILAQTVDFQPKFTCARLWVSNPGGAGMKWHLDRTSPTQTKPGTLLRVLVALSETTEANCTEFLDLGAAQELVVAESWKRHNMTADKGFEYTEDHDVPHGIWTEMASDAKPVPLLMPQWSVSVIDGANFFHRRRDNVGDYRRSVMAMDFVDANSDAAQLTKDAPFGSIIPLGYPVENQPPSLETPGSSGKFVGVH